MALDNAQTMTGDGFCVDFTCVPNIIILGPAGRLN